jgi:hypothetical protein
VVIGTPIGKFNHGGTFHLIVHTVDILATGARC